MTNSNAPFHSHSRASDPLGQNPAGKTPFCDPSSDTTKFCRPRTRARRVWDNYGSWLILIIVVGVSWNAGQEWQAHKDQATVEALIISHATERQDLRNRLRDLNDRNQALAAQLAPTTDKAIKAVKDATKAINALAMPDPSDPSNPSDPSDEIPTLPGMD